MPSSCALQLHQLAIVGCLLALGCQAANYQDLLQMQQLARDQQHQAANFSWHQLATFGAQLPTGNVSASCAGDVALLMKDLSAGKSWAAQFVDAIGKPPSGLLDGAGTWLGSFDECLEAKGPVGANFSGQYCLLQLATSPHPPGEKPQFHVGTCWPSSCSIGDAEQVADAVLPELFAILRAPQSLFVVPGAQQCKRPISDLQLSNAAIVMITILSIFGLLIILGTLIDLYHQVMASLDADQSSSDELSQSVEVSGDNTQLLQRYGAVSYNSGITTRLLLCFSLHSNASKIFSYQEGDSRLGCVHGIRFISMAWIILGHTYLLNVVNIANPGRVGLAWLNDWKFQAVLNGTVAVDSFFVLSGSLVSHLFLRDLDRRQGHLKRINWLMFYLHRWWRLTPTYMLILGCYVTLSPYFYNGPMYPQQIGGFEPQCRTSWWRNLLYINNLIGEQSDMCMAWMWYIANDMQFYIISPLLLIPLARKPVLGLVLLLLSALAVTVAIGVHSTISNRTAGASQDFSGTYIKPWFRIGPYLVGIVAGFLVHLARKRQASGRVRIHKALNLLGWCCAAAVCLSVVYGLYNVQRGRDHLPQAVASLYNCSFRLVWAIGVAWVIFTCCTGNGGWVNAFLSHPFFIPLSKLTYCAYLVHPIVIITVVTTRRDAVQWDNITVMYNFIGNLNLSFAVAFAAALVFEMPLLTLERQLRDL